MSRYTKTQKKIINSKKTKKKYTTKTIKNNNNILNNIKLLIENNKDLNKNYSSKYKIIIGRVFDINYSNIQIIIKINDCKSEYKNINSYKIKNFTTKKKENYLCKNEINTEYMLHKYIQLKKDIEYIEYTHLTSKEKEDIIKEYNIYIKLINRNLKKICKKNCSIKFLIYTNVIKFDLFGLLFLVNLIDLWYTKNQEEFINTYSKKNIKLFLIEIKKKIIKEISNKIDYLYKMDKKEFNINKKYDLYYKLLLYKLFHEIRSYNNNYINDYNDNDNKNNKNNALNINEDYKFINVEFKNINVLDNIDKIQNYINDIRQMYYKVLIQCSNDLYHIRLEYDPTLPYHNY